MHSKPESPGTKTKGKTMKKRIIATTIGATLVGLLIGSTLGIPGGASAKSELKSISSSRMSHDSDGVRPGAKAPHGRGIGKDIEGLVSVLKLTAEELRTQLKSGKTLAEIATAQKVDVAVVVDAIVAPVKTHIAEKVSAGEITQAQADVKLAEVKTRVTEMVNSTRPAHGRGDHRGKGFGRTPHSHEAQTESELKTEN